MKEKNSSHNASFIFAHHIRACGFCAQGARRFLLERGLTNEEIQAFYKTGMCIEIAKKRFGSDALAQQVIQKALEDGKEKSANGRL